jgi:hypothetical protein
MSFLSYALPAVLALSLGLGLLISDYEFHSWPGAKPGVRARLVRA